MKESYPDAEFRLLDIADPNLDLDQNFDYISIFDVLFHIIDDNRFAKAIENLARLCKPGCKIFITDIFGSKTTASVKHCRNRSLTQYENEFSHSGFRLIDLKPLFFTLLPPARFSNSFIRWTGILIWEMITFVTRWAFFGNIIGCLLYNFDRALFRFFRRGPSGHLAIFEFEGVIKEE